MHERATGALQDILDWSNRILTFTRDRREHDLWDDKLLRSAIERCFEIVAEALCRLRSYDAGLFEQITDADVVIRLRTAILHKYDEIDYGILWRATRKELPGLIQQVEILLKKSS